MEHITLPVADKLELKDYVALLQCSKNIYNTIKYLLSIKKKEFIRLLISYSRLFTEIYCYYPSKAKEGLYISFNSISHIFVKCMYSNGMLTSVYKEYFSIKWVHDDNICSYLRVYMDDMDKISKKSIFNNIVKNNMVHIYNYNGYKRDITDYLWYINKVNLGEFDAKTFQYTEDDLKYTCIYINGTITEPVTFKTNQECIKQIKKCKKDNY